MSGTSANPASEPPPSSPAEIGTGWEGWEDAAVDPAQLGSYLRAIRALMNEYGYSSAMYGHFGQGCVHMRLNFDLETPAGILKFRQFMDHAADIALAHGGSLSGEHGDGQARGALLPKMFGEELMQAFRTFKHIFDPTNRMNPGKLIDAHQPHEDLRLGADYKPWQPKTHFAYAEDNGTFASANLRCVGVGACRKTDAGTMCPSFMATGEELHSTRGRAHLLWELMQGEVLPDQWKNKQVKESLDLCLSCKACKSECPVSVDMATYKAEFLAHHYEGESRPLAHYAFGRIDVFARIASIAPHLVNAINNAPIISSLVKKILHIHPQRTFPRFAKPFTPDRRLARDPQRRHDRRPALPDTAPRVFLWADTFNNYFHPSTMRAAHQVLTHRRLPRHTAQPPPLLRPSPLRLRHARHRKKVSPQNPRRARSSAPRRHTHRRPRTKLRLRLPRRTHQPTSQRSPRRETPRPDLPPQRVPRQARPQLSARRNSTKRSSSTATATIAPPWACTTRSPSSASPAQKSNSSTPAAAAWPAPSASKKKNSPSRKN